MPFIEGADVFGAPLFHVKDFPQYAETLQSSKEVVILGGTKSAFDVAYAYGKADTQVHMVMRESGHGPMWVRT